MNLGHWLKRIKTKRKQRDKESAEKITKSGDEFRRKGRGGPVPPSASALGKQQRTPPYPGGDGGG